MNVIEGHGVHPVEQYSHVYFSFPRQGDDTKTYLFDFHSESPDQYHVDAYLRNAEGWHEVSSSFASGSFPRASLSIDSSLEGGELVVIVTNVANQDHDIDTSPWEGRQFSYRFEKRADQPID
jgi:hypothetical protein